MHKIAEAIFGEELEVIPTYFEGTPPENANDRLWYLGKSIEKMSEADCFIGIFDDQKDYDGCIIENHVAKLYGVPQYLVNIAYVAPDIMERRLQHMVCWYFSSALVSPRSNDPVGECPRRKMAALRKQLDLYF